MSDSLIRTKLRVPFTRGELVDRPRLGAQLERGLRGPLTLVTAPAGFGKTTLVAAAIGRCGLPVAWLSLDQNDSHLWRFLTYLVAALDTAASGPVAEAARLLAASQPVPADVVLTSLVNGLEMSGSEMVVVLDDYHAITDQAVHNAVTFLLDHCPLNLHLVIAGRSDPPFPLARLRARGQVLELRAADLRFSTSEAAQFLNDTMGLALDAASMAVLGERTEGWIAGLQMAALSLRHSRDAAAFVASFSGTHRYILDYLLEEVLSSQPPEIRRFLLCTSILERLTAPLCDAVLSETSESGVALDRLERDDLFLVPLDDDRTWYRYHHLFADLLRTILRQELGDREILVLHARAARWHEERGLIDAAISHAALAKDDAYVEGLIERNYMEIFQRRESSAIRYWTGDLVKGLILRRPRLCIYEATSRAWLGWLDEAAFYLDRAEAHLIDAPATPENLATRGHLDYTRSRITAMRGDVRSAIRLCISARDNTPVDNAALQGAIGVMLGYAHFLSGKMLEAEQTLRDTIAAGIAAGATNTTVAAYCVLARTYAVRGSLLRSYRIYEQAEDYLSAAHGELRGARAIVDAGLADALYEWNDLVAARKRAERALQAIHHWDKADDTAMLHVTLARIHLAQGDAGSAVEAVATAANVIRATGVFGDTRDAVTAVQIRLALARDDHLALARWTEVARRASAEGNGFRNELACLALARSHIVAGDLGRALELLSAVAAEAGAGGRAGRLVEAQALLALALRALDRPADALATVGESLRLAQPERYARVYLDEGRPMQMLLSAWLAQAGAGAVRSYVEHLLDQFPTWPSEVPRAAALGATGVLVEPLTPREREVLALLAQGKTNREIAAALVVARGTVKAHTAAIYRKLDVHNRTEAVARARQLGILG